MKHVKTFESFLSESQINEGAIGSKINGIWNKYKKSGIEMTTGDDLAGFLSDGELDPACENAVKALGNPKDLLDFSTVNGGEDKFPKFLEDIKKSGLRHEYYVVDHGGPCVVVENK